jgi:hypothetical protein
MRTCIHRGGRRRKVTALVASVVATSALGCPAGEPREAGAASATFEVAAEPSLVIGELGSEVSLHRIWPPARRLVDGRILVPDGVFSPRLLVFSPDGKALGTIGREGDGPGEHAFIGSVQAGPDDSIFVYDRGHQRLSVFMSDGRLVRSATFAVTQGVTGGDGLERVTRLADGIWVAAGTQSVRNPPPGTIVRDTIVIGVVNGRMEELRSLERVPARMSTSIEIEGRGLFGAPPFSPTALHATWGRCVFVSSGETPRIAVYASDGTRVSEFDGPGTLRPVTEQHLEARLAWRLSISPEEEHPMERRLMQSVAKTENLPFYHALLVDAWGHVWLQEYEPPWGQGPRWYVLSQTGDLLADVVMPKDMTVHEISEYGVLATTVGEFDEERIEVLPWITAPSPAAPPLPACVAS